MSPQHTAYAITREIVDVGDAVRAAGPPPTPVVDGDFSLRTVDPGSGSTPSTDPGLLASWFARPHLVQTWDQAWDADRWRADARYRLSGDYSRPIIFAYRGVDVGYLEVYRVARDEIAALYDVHPHDLGLHVATADTALLGRGLVSGLMRAVADGLFAADPECRTVAVEPASDNAPMRRALVKRGWSDRGEFQIRPTRRIALHLLARPAVS